MSHGKFGVFWRLLRPFTLTASIVPALIGSGLAFTLGHFRPLLFVAFTLASCLIQAATNMFNEYFDYKRGLDDEGMVGIAGTIVRDGMSPRFVWWCAWVCIDISVALGAFICAQTSWYIALVGVACMLIAYLYSGGPKPLSYTPFGELAASIAMGPVIVLLAFYTQASEITGRATAVSVPIGLLIGAILLANNIRDLDQDKAGGRRTIAILIGRERGRVLFGAVFAIAYLVVLLLIVLGWLTPLALLVLLTVPSAFYVTKLYYRFTEPAKLHVAVKGTAILLFRFGVIMFVAMVASIWMPIK